MRVTVPCWPEAEADVSPSGIFAHIARDGDGSSVGVWGAFTLRTAFQPIFAFHENTLAIAAFEGLIRPYRHGQPVQPAAFLAALPVGDRLQVETLARTLHLANAATCLPESASVFVNFDPSIFVDRSIASAALSDTRNTLAQVGIKPGRVVCEVTEQRSASQQVLRDFVRSFRQAGFRIAIDDYGAEDSDIERIRVLRPEIVKFDAHWVARLMETGPGLGLLKAMVGIFAGQGITTVFEGIEESRQIGLAEQAGVAMVQGFALARPELAPANFATFPRTAMPVARRGRGQPVHSMAGLAGETVGPRFGRKVAP
jgi:EAL domain-containing protein (putative c-di-GMP-specific phosphodiesterase class I)